jgi:hypothetical protein
MGHTDAEGSNGITPPVQMAMLLDPRVTMQVHVPFTCMVVRMHMPAFLDQSPPQYPAKEHEHDAHAELGCQREWFRNRDAEPQYHRSDQQQYYRMSEPPAESDHAGGTERGSLCEHGGYGSQMVRVQCVT